MASTYTVHFKGGPEDGDTQVWSRPPPPPASINWGGDVYERTSDTGKDVHYQFNAEATKLALPGLPGINAAWSRLMRALGVNAPKQLIRINRATLEIRRLTRNYR